MKEFKVPLSYTPQLPTPTFYADVLLNTLGTHGLIKLRENNTVYVRNANF